MSPPGPGVESLARVRAETRQRSKRLIVRIVNKVNGLAVRSIQQVALRLLGHSEETFTDQEATLHLAGALGALKTFFSTGTMRDSWLGLRHRKDAQGQPRVYLVNQRMDYCYRGRKLENMNYYHFVATMRKDQIKKGNKEKRSKVTGVIKVKEFALRYLKESKRELRADEIMKPNSNLLTVYADTNLLEMLMLFQAKSTRVALVCNLKKKIDPKIESIMYSVLLLICRKVTWS